MKGRESQKYCNVNRYIYIILYKPHKKIFVSQQICFQPLRSVVQPLSGD